MNDLNYALRMFARNPGFTITCLAALALGIGANAAIFSVVNAVLLQPLPYPDSDRIVNIARPSGSSISEPLFAYWEQNNTGFESLAAYRRVSNMSLSGGDKPQLVETIAASRDYFRLFGAHAVLGRTFTAAEDAPGGSRVLVMSYGLWQQRFGADLSILGKNVVLGGAPYSIIGVLSADFKPLPPADVWIPLQADPGSTNQAGILTVCGHLPAGTTLAESNARLAAIDHRYVETHPRQLRIDLGIRGESLKQQITGNARPALLILLGAVGLVLLIACANVANLLLARATARQREIAIRAALGAGHLRIVRQLLTESLVLALTGGLLGLALGSWGVRTLLAFLPGDLPRAQEVAAIPALDPRVAGFTFVLAAATGILFGLAPVFQLLRSRPKHKLRSSSFLVTAEVAIAVVLTCGAMLLIRSFAAMHSVALGFDSDQVLTMEVSLAGAGYSDSNTVERIARQLVERAERIPGVESAATASALPLWGKMDMLFDIPGRTANRFIGDVQWRIISPEYFRVLRIPLLSGRFLQDQEPGRTVVISEAMARRFWSGTNPVGQTIFIGPGLGTTYQLGPTQIVGVVGDVRERLYFGATPVMYQLPSQIPDADMSLVNSLETAAILVRTRPGVPPMSLASAVQNALQSGNSLAVAKVRTMDQAALDSTARQNFNLLLLGLFAAIALLLAAVGIYGVMSYSVAQRTHEIGIRAALGAGPREILKLILGRASRMALAGAAVGIAASFGLTRLLAAQLFGVNPLDPVTFTVAPLILLATALAAAWIPARRASRVDPAIALRHE